MIGPFRRIAPHPPLWLIPLIGAAVLLAGGLLIAIADSHTDFSDVFGPLAVFLYYVSVGWLLVFAGYRVLAFNPLINRNYYDWLSRSAWRPGKPLPAGPMLLTWRDLLLVSLIALGWQLVAWTAAAANAGYNWYFFADHARSWALVAGVGLTFFISYAAVWFAVSLVTDRVISYAMLLVLLVAWPFHRRIAMSATLVVWVLLAQFGIWRMLRMMALSFRLNPNDGVQPILCDPRQTTRPHLRQSVHLTPTAWPHNVLAPIEDRSLMARWERVWLTVLATVFWHNLILEMGWDGGSGPAEGLALLIGLYTAVVCFLRACVYCFQVHSPISLLGRVLTKRWIIPGYDRIFVPLLVTGVIGYAAHRFVEWQARSLDTLPFRLAVTAALAALTWHVMSARPRLSEWQLTAPSRRTPIKPWIRDLTEPTEL